MPGPAPNPNARRRNARPDVTTLPAEGRKGDPPAWPLAGRKKQAELDLWAVLWSTPQAVAWEGLGEGTVRTIARYCRLSLEAESPKAMATIHTEVRQLEDRLGLTPMSMRRLMWEIAVDEVSEQREAGTKTTERRTRLKAVDTSAVAGT